MTTGYWRRAISIYRSIRTDVCPCWFTVWPPHSHSHRHKCGSWCHKKLPDDKFWKRKLSQLRIATKWGFCALFCHFWVSTAQKHKKAERTSNVQQDFLSSKGKVLSKASTTDSQEQGQISFLFSPCNHNYYWVKIASKEGGAKLLQFWAPAVKG